MHQNIKKGLFLFSVLAILAGCKKENKSNNSSATKGKLTLVSGNGQSGTYGQDLADTIVIILKPVAGTAVNKYVVKYNMVQGNGLVEGVNPDYTPYSTLNPDGSVKIKWRLGCNNPSQKLTVCLYPDSVINQRTGLPSAPPDDSVTVSASGAKPNGWGRACGCGAPNYNIKIASYDKQTLYMANNGLFSSTDGGVNWYKVSGVPNWSTITDVQFNSKGWMYVLTANNGVYFTQDEKTWTAINNGILDMRTPTMFLVTDDLLMVSFYFDGPYLTTNNGGFWQKLLTGYGSQRFYLAKQHPNGSIYLFNDWNELLTSRDTGKTWQLIPLSNGLLYYEAYDLEIGPNGLIYIGSDNATISYISPQTNQGSYQSYYQYNASTQPLNNIQFYNNNVYFLVNDSPHSGIYSGSNNSYSLINTGFNGTISYYYIRQDGSFLLGSYDGIYYRN